MNNALAQVKDRRRGKPRNNASWLGVPTQKQFKQQQAAKIRHEFKPLDRAIRSEMRGYRARANQDIPAWFGEAEQNIDQRAGSTAAAYQTANDQLKNLLSGAQANDQANQKTLAESQAEFSKLTGSPVSTAPNEAASASAARRAQLEAAFGGMIANQGANASAYMQGQAANTKLAGIDARRKELNKLKTGQDDLQALQQKKADAYQINSASDLKDLRAYVLQRGALGLDKRNAKLDATQAAADRANDAFDNRLDAAEAAERARHNRATEDGDAAEARQDAREKRTELRTEIREAAALLRRAEKGEYTNPLGAIDYLIGKGISPRAAKAAVKRAMGKKQSGTSPTPHGGFRP